MARHSRKHFRLLHNGGPDTPEAVAERLLHREAVQRLELERAARWPASPSVEDARAMLAWQERRLEELKAELKSGRPSSR